MPSHTRPPRSNKPPRSPQLMEKLWLAHGYDTQQHQRARVPSNMDETVPVKRVSAAKADVGKLFLKNFFGGETL